MIIRSSSRCCFFPYGLILLTLTITTLVSAASPIESYVDNNAKVNNEFANKEQAVLRGSSSSSSPPSEKRRHVIKRVYGPENAIARKHVAKLEERMERYQTGINKENHQLEYENHPFDESNRNLQDGAVMDDLYQPVRIAFETMALDGQRNLYNGAQIDFIKNEILPRTRDFWSNALAVVPVFGNLYIAANELDNREYCGDSEFTEVPVEHMSDGIPNIDLMVYVSGAPSSRFCAGSTLAVAVACNFDQFDRPTAGAINFCLDQIELQDDGTASAAVIEDNTAVAIHEAAHILGMSSNSYRFYWDTETKAPRTQRPFSTKTVTCVDGRTRSLVLPDENTMKFFLAENGQRYASIVTPKVQVTVRNQFNCQVLAGGQLENQPTGAESCTGDHWDERLFYPEALSGVISPTTNILSHMTLALFEDSGWYKANYTQGKANPWGLNAGCDFVTNQCLIPGGDAPSIPEYSKGFFCNNAAERGCSPAHTHKLQCTVIDYDHIYPRKLPDLQFQYFNNEPSRGGPRQADYCPVFGSTYGGLDAEQLRCENPDHAGEVIQVNSEMFGRDSKCFETNSGEGRCYLAACVKDVMKVKFNVRSEWHTCDYDFQKMNVKVNNVQTITITCPRLSSACPDLFCPFNCAGRGTCDYKAMVNGTMTPKCVCFDENDQTPGCSDSLVPDGGFFQDSSGLLSSLEENFFDPLVSVFVDHPDKWTRPAWAWAGGLMILLFILLICICSSFWPGQTKRVSQRRY